MHGIKFLSGDLHQKKVNHQCHWLAYILQLTYIALSRLVIKILIKCFQSKIGRNSCSIILVLYSWKHPWVPFSSVLGRKKLFWSVRVLDMMCTKVLTVHKSKLCFGWCKIYTGAWTDVLEALQIIRISIRCNWK